MFPFPPLESGGLGLFTVRTIQYSGSDSLVESLRGGEAWLCFTLTLAPGALGIQGQKSANHVMRKLRHMERPCWS